MKNTHIMGIISVTVLLLSTITIYGYESSGNKNINTYEATHESTPSVTTIPATTTPVTTNTTTKPVTTIKPVTKPTTKPVATTKPVSKPTTKPVTTTKPTATKPKTTTAAKNNVKETTKIYNKVKSISLDKKAIRLNKGDKRTLTSYVKYKKRKKGVNEPLIWKTSNKKVATVSRKGVVKGKSNGKAYITLKSKITGKTVKCKVTVAKTKYVAFTFDDGPGIYTDKLLKALDKNNAKATFFVVGSCVNSHKTQLKNEYKLHMEIGSHTYNHSNLKTLSVPQIKKELGSTNKVVKSVIGTTPTLLRPPYGSYNKTTGKYAGVPMIYWSVDTLDWKYRNVNYVSSTILKETKAWDIVLLHDIHQTSVDGFIKALPTLKKRGYELVTVSELYSLKGKKLKNGVMYFSPNRD